MRPAGLIFIVIALVAPLYWFVPLASQHDPVALFSQYMGAASLVAMGIALVLATRVAGLQAVFGGLDRMYVLHKWLAVVALAMAAIHDTVDAEMDGIRPEFGFGDLGETLGEIGFYGVMVLIFVTLIRFIPYPLWRWSHRFIGVFFALSALHFILIERPFSLADPLGLYILVFCVLGLVSFLYMTFLYVRFPGPARYRITDIAAFEGVREVTLEPLGRGFRHRAGQFAFINFDAPDLQEIHPFTISGAPSEDRSLRFAIKALGDYTATLQDRLQVGTDVRVWGPYGHLRRPADKRPEVWIAAGIGITPFMAWAREIVAAGGKIDGPVTLFYCVRTTDKASFLNELQDIFATIDGATLIVVESERAGRLTAAIVSDTVGQQTLVNSHVFFCGPEAMRRGLKHDLVALGVPKGRFHYEEFEIRSGLGIRRLLARLLRQFQVGRQLLALEQHAAQRLRALTDGQYR